MVVDIKFADESFEAAILVGIEKAEEMHPVFGAASNPLKTKMPASWAAGTSSAEFFNPVMVGDGDHFDAMFFAGRHDGVL